MAAANLAGVAALAAWVGLRARRKRRVETEVRVRHVRGTDGVIHGAEPIALDGGGRGALLLHGFGDTPQSMRGLAEHLHGRGWTVRAPLLPGHGRTLEAFAASRRADWYAAALAAHDALRRETPVVALIGQSMGGALAVRVAAARPDVTALVLLAPYLTMLPWVGRLARLHLLVSLVTPYLRSRTSASIHDAAARAKSLGYGYASPRLLRELQHLVREAWSEVPQVRVPTLMLQARQDNRISPRGADAAFGRLRAAPRELVWIEDGGHVLTVDVACGAVMAATTAWVERFTALQEDSRRTGTVESA